MPAFTFSPGTDDFKELRDGGYYYVDKSALIADVIHGGKITLLPRPRRFGKTLNMSMLRYFFDLAQADAASLFADQTVANHEAIMAHQGKYPTIYLTLKSIRAGSWMEVSEQLARLVSALLRQHGYLSGNLPEIEQQAFDRLVAGTGSNVDLRLSLANLISQLYAHHQHPVVVLIDEYDSPIIHAWHNGYFDEMIEFMRSWLGEGLKHENGPALFRGVVTGILRVAKESIFSGLNHLDVHSCLTPGPFADKFGFTQREIDKVLVDFELPDLAGEIQEWYNGYNFGGHTICNPWSVINVVNRQPNPPEAYWVNTSDNRLIHEQLEKGDSALKADLEVLLGGGSILRKLEESTVFSALPKSRDAVWSFFVSSGYLRAEDAGENPRKRNERLHRLTIPNLEVSTVFEAFVAYWHRSIDFHRTDILLDALLDEDYPGFERELSDLVRCLVSCHDVARQPEAVYHALVLGLLANLRSIYSIRSNAESGYGRADILMQPKTAAYPLGFIIEFKSIKPAADPTKATAEALQQIEDRAYEAQLLEADVAPEHIRKLAIVFSGQRVTVTAP